jgi:hypothetical protein
VAGMAVSVADMGVAAAMAGADTAKPRPSEMIAI